MNWKELANYILNNMNPEEQECPILVSRNGDACFMTNGRFDSYLLNLSTFGEIEVPFIIFWDLNEHTCYPYFPLAKEVFSEIIRHGYVKYEDGGKTNS